MAGPNVATERFDLDGGDDDAQGRGQDRPWTNRIIFEEKVAQNPMNQFTEDGQEKWKKTIRNYMIGKRDEMKNMLNWAESFQKQVISFQNVADLRSGGQMTDTGFDPVRASAELWAFLNLNLTGSAKNKFDKAEELNGLDVWRRVVVPIAPPTVVKRIEMHGVIHQPGKAKKLSELVDFIEAWEKLLEKYYEMGAISPVG